MLAALAPHTALSLAAFALTGFAFGPVIPALLSLAAAADDNGAAVATATTTSYAGFAGSPLLVAGLSAVAGLPVAVACLGLLALPLLGAALTGRSDGKPGREDAPHRPEKDVAYCAGSADPGKPRHGCTV